MQKINCAASMKVAEIVFTDGSKKQNAEIMFAGDFIIVAANAGPPTMFNVRMISELRCVEQIRQQVQPKISVW